MNRRDFVKASSLITIPILLKSCDWAEKSQSYPIHVNSDAKTGHLIRKSQEFDKLDIAAIDTLIVGGGIAGLSAACQLKDRDFLLCELSENMGGTSSAYNSDSLTFSQGAHYDLGYPSTYGKEVIELFENLNIIKYQPWKDSWGFVDDQYIITHRRKNQCYDNGELRKDVLREGSVKQEFFQLLEPYLGQMHLPTRLIDSKYHVLNDISFIDFLKGKINLDEDFVKGLSYHMKDDYGCNAYDASALAGIHYFMCRPYYNEIVELFSPPEGNNYFIKKMADHVGSERLLTKHLVKSITDQSKGFKVEIIDIENQVIKSLAVKKVVYAGQKHALQYIYPQDHELFKANNYAPWMVVNIVIDDSWALPGYWQNEMFTADETFMGFVDSNTQNKASNGQRTLTAYYCLPPQSRKDLINVEANKSKIAEATINQISNYFGQELYGKVKLVDIKVMGHAMPTPGKGYLFDDKNQYRNNKNIAYAGVDNSRLPLLYEAVDSGIIAGKWLDLGR